MKIGNQAWQTIVNGWFYHIEEGGIKVTPYNKPLKKGKKK